MKLTSIKGVTSAESLRIWALENYEAGASTLVECYTLQDLRDNFFRDGKWDLDLVLALVDIWADREANADYARRTAQW